MIHKYQLTSASWRCYQLLCITQSLGQDDLLSGLHLALFPPTRASDSLLRNQTTSLDNLAGN